MTLTPDRARSLLPDPLFYRAVAAGYRFRPEQRLLFLDEFTSGARTVVDIGAWWGPWTYWLSRRAASVWSFEPNPALAWFLFGVVGSNVRVENVALSDRSGEGILFASDVVGRDALATLSQANSEAGARRIEVPLRRLDDYNIDAVDFIKIDVEGHEFEVLKGAEKTLARCRPQMLIEIDQALHEEPIQEIFDWLEARGFEGRLRRSGAWAPMSTFDLDADQPATTTDPSSRIIDFLFSSAD